MGYDEQVVVFGVDDVCARLSRAPQIIVKNCFADALLAAAAPISEALYAACPVSAKNELFNDETFEVLKGTGTGKTKSALIADVRIDPAARGGDLQVGFGKRGKVARMVEFGHRQVTHWANKVTAMTLVGGKRRKRTTKSGGHQEVGQVVAHPFMGPAAASSADAAMEAFDVALGASLDKYTGGI